MGLGRASHSASGQGRVLHRARVGCDIGVVSIACVVSRRLYVAVCLGPARADDSTTSGTSRCQRGALNADPPARFWKEGRSLGIVSFAAKVEVL